MTDRQERLLIVGGSAAGARAAQAALAASPTVLVDVLSKDRAAPYYRPSLSKQLLQGSWTTEQATQPTPAHDRLRWHAGARAVTLDAAESTVVTAESARFEYDKLLICSGCRPRRLSDYGAAPATAQNRIFELDQMGDVEGLRRALPPAGHVLVIGAGLVGSEAAASLLTSGFRVTVVDPMTTPLLRALGPVGDRVSVGWLRASDAEVLLGLAVEELSATPTEVRARLSNGEVIGADVALTCLGVTPATKWIAGSGLPLGADGSVSCDAYLLVKGHPGIAAAGDIAQWDSPLTGQPVRVEHWLTAVEQGAVAARNLLLPDSERSAFGASPMFWTEQHGHLVHMIGHHGPESDWEVLEGADDGPLVAAATNAGCVTGYLLVDSARRLPHYKKELTTQVIPALAGQTPRRQP